MARAKAKALQRVPQTREEAVRFVGEIGTLRRQLQARKAAADEQIKAIGVAVEEALQPIAEQLKEFEDGLQAWCEAHREELTSSGRVKFHDFGTGRVMWRLRPPKVTIRNVEGVIEAFKRLGLARFVRVKEEVNKEALLAEPQAARGLNGVTIGTEGEDFVVEPAELQLAEA